MHVFHAMVRKFLGRHAEVIRENHVPGKTVLVAHPLDLASRVYRDADPTTPMFSALLAPILLRTHHDPPRVTPWRIEISRPAWLIRSAYTMVDHLVVDPFIAGPVNRLRREFGLPKVRRVLNDWWFSPDGVLALFPDWFAPSTVGFHPAIRHCGFPLDDVDGADFEVPSDRPLVFTSGTAHRHCRRFFRDAISACNDLDRPGLLLTSYPENLPDEIPSGIRTMHYASLRQLLPHCSGIVHHGGIGTTAQSLAAGIPQVIRPLAFDQFDNATRVERLGCGRWLRQDSKLAATLRELLDPAAADTHRALEEASARLKGTSGARVAADYIEDIARVRCTQE